jgi:YVTN family beta-propeller protein
MKAIPRVMLSAVIMLAGAEYCGAQDAPMPYYVGLKKCLECHSPDRGVRVCSLEAIPEHDHSIRALAKPEAEHIAALCGITEAPQQSRICLGCHATAADDGSRWTTESFNLADGVQCEACHGAGSLHVEAFDRQRSHPPSSAESHILPGERDSCTHCHRKRESHRQVLRLGYRRPPEDALYKTPVNLATSADGEWLYVVCENSNSLAVVDLGTREVVDEIAVGLRPHDVAISPDGNTLYVTNRMSDSLSVINSPSRRVVSEIAVGDEPHGVLTDASGRHVYVLNTAQDSISVIDARELRETKRLASGRGPWSLARSPDGRSMSITSVWPNAAPFRETSHSEITVLSLKDGVVRARATATEANMLEGIAYVPGSDVVLFTLMRTKNLVPLTRLAQGWTLTHGLGILWPDSRIDQVLLDEPNAAFSDPGDVAVSPDGRFALVSSGGADQVAVVAIDDLLSVVTSASDVERRDILPNHLGMSSRFVRQRIAVGNNPRGIVFSQDGRLAFVANALADSVTVIETEGFTVVDEILLGGPAEISETRWGARLFHSADNAFGKQFSCRSCHPDGHINGLTFDIEPDGLGMDPVDNRTLRGILDTAPFKWEGTNPTLSARRTCRTGPLYQYDREAAEPPSQPSRPHAGPAPRQSYLRALRGEYRTTDSATASVHHLPQQSAQDCRHDGRRGDDDVV